VDLPWRRLLRAALVALLLTGVVMAGGRAIERVALGSDSALARQRVQSDVRSAFDEMARGLGDKGRTLAQPATIRAAAAGDTAAARALFTAAAAAVAGEDDIAITVYGAEGRPLAWAGRPSDLPPSPVPGGDTWFVAQGPLGVRLVYVHPVDDGATRLGLVAVERPVPLSGIPGAPGGLRDGGADAFRFPTRLAPVSILPPRAGAQVQAGTTSFEVAAPSGDRLLVATLSDRDLDATRGRWRSATRSLAFLVGAVALALAARLLLDWRNRARRRSEYALALVLAASVVLLTRWLLLLASPADWSSVPLFSPAYASPQPRPLLGSPLDFLLTTLAGACIVAIVALAVEAGRLNLRQARRAVTAPGWTALFLLGQFAAGGIVALIVVGQERFLEDTIARTTIDLLQFSLRPFNSARLALQIGLVIAHATAIGLAAMTLRASLAAWRGWRDWRLGTLAAVCWVLPYVAWQAGIGTPAAGFVPRLASVAISVLLALGASRLIRWYRHGSQALRLSLLTLGLVIPAWAFYPTVFQLALGAKVELVEARYASQARNQRQMVQTQLQESLGQIDRFPGLADLLTSGPPSDDESSRLAFQVWQGTSLSSYPVTSSVEIYGPDRALISRFAFNLPEDLASPVSEEENCGWELYEGVAPFFAEERRVLHAGRLVCAAGPAAPPLGSVVVRAILDYENLPFIYSRSPYVELMRPSDPLRDERLAGRDVEFAVYGWSRTPLYQSGDTAWPLTDGVFARIEQGRGPFWAVLTRRDAPFAVYLQNDRGGIYALGFPVVSMLGHLMNLAEMTVLAACAFFLLLTAHRLAGLTGGRTTDAPALLREVRASFYRKLFIAFVMAVFLPVVALALGARIYVADQLRARIEQEAVRTASAARRVVEDLVAPRAAQQGFGVDDNLMVWVSRLIDQDVNVFAGPRLQATSERNLFASGLLPTRTTAEAYHALELRREAATVTTERIGGSEHLVAATPLTVRQFDAAILSVPLTSRQREIDQEIESLDRRVLLSVLLFMIGGAGLGYVMAERISDPVNRLTRATRRIARGEFDTNIPATSSDELKRLVEDFNSMVRELLRQRRELERTNRLEAWAEMARQVAHEIKNPLTPIQLNAEHLRRVHADRGRPLTPVLEECVETILTQVKLLRQIASEFSSFASAPTARPASVEVPDLVHEILDPYRTGLAGRIRFQIDVPPTLPSVHVDRTLIARALANLVENALHAMPGTGTLTVVAQAAGGRVRIRVSDTGVGMDAEALGRAFEPYFSTKATGTGLGLPIAKRNVELNGGTISVSSGRDTGTTVELTLPISA
jgi:signal transduction histidine kinase